MVWKAAITPRIVAVIPKPCPKDRDEEKNPKSRDITLLRGIPALLAVNKEARHLALRHYIWRFTIDTTISWRWRFPGIPLQEGEHRYARVVMSPDDTLGLFPFRQVRPVLAGTGCISNFDLKVANDKTSPWKIHETTCAPQQGFKNVAIFGKAIMSNLHIVRALNITLWDLDSILHADSAEMRVAHSPHTKHRILVESGDMTELDWVCVRSTSGTHQRLLPRFRQSPDILAFELADGEKHEEDWETFLDLLSQPTGM